VRNARCAPFLTAVSFKAWHFLGSA